ncbi:MAG: type IX secretion system protein PorQ [Paludibacteraceae bacterium]|nr:type IX secretion system protein PorQ [Paludibacteraceae bacterium]MBP6283812.1 type IX secretion system protein PorQ [Paludibacteraceae bacterium]
MKKLVSICVGLCVLSNTVVSAQSFISPNFLEQPASAHLAALGGNNISFSGKDIAFSFSNPALLSLQHSNELSLNVASYFAGTGYGSGLYSHSIAEKGMWSAGFQYIDYGQFEGFDEFGVGTGSFSAKDIALQMTYAHRLNPYFSIGATLKPVLGVYERYTLFALASDFGILFVDEESQLQIGFTARNIGAQFAGYESAEPSSLLPLNISVGVSKRLTHAPFVFHLTMQQLQRWNYDVSTNVVPDNELSFASLLARHFIVGVDVLPPSERFWLALSYNFLRGQELPVPELFSLAGFSGGIGFYIRDVELGIGFGSYHQAATTLHISLRTDLSKFGL